MIQCWCRCSESQHPHCLGHNDHMFLHSLLVAEIMIWIKYQLTQGSMYLKEKVQSLYMSHINYPWFSTTKLKILGLTWGPHLSPLLRYIEATNKVSAFVPPPIVVLSSGGATQTFFQLGSSLDVLTHCLSRAMSALSWVILGASSFKISLAALIPVMLYFVLLHFVFP